MISIAGLPTLKRVYLTHVGFAGSMGGVNLKKLIFTALNVRV